MKKLFLLLFSFSVFAESNPYDEISARNAFDLTSEKLAPILPPITDIIAPTIFLTGITSWNGVRKIHLVLRRTGEPDKFVSLRENESQYNIGLMRILPNSATVSINGKQETINFERNSFPAIVTKKPAPKSAPTSSRYSRDRKDEKKEEKKISSPSPKAQVVTVPSRRPQVDPRIIEKGLEYLSRMEEGEKRDYLLKRMESLQSGQRQIKSDIDQNERRRQYDEWNKRRDK